MPSRGVVEVILATEKAFRLIMPSPKLMEILPSTRLLDIRIQAVVLSHLRSKIHCLFPQLSDHALDFDISLFDDHITHLIREIAKLFLRMRLHKAAKLHHERIVLKGASSKRMKNNKIVLFSGE